MQVTSLSQAGGILVEGVDLSKPRPPGVDAELKRLYDLHGLVVIRGYQLTKQQLVDAGEIFGGTQIDPPATVRDPEVPGIIVISTRGTTGDVVPTDKVALVGELEWHTDQGYVPAPNRGKILYAVQVPEEGGKTGFIDNQLTYQALSEEMKAKIEGLHVIQSWNRAESHLQANRDYRIGGDKEMVSDKFPDMVYPLVYEHPVSGAKILNVIPLWDAGILELPGPDGDALLKELLAHVLQPKFQYWHQYQVGDAVLWDNWRSLHAASGTPGKYVRTLWSIVIQPGPDLGYPIPKGELSKTRRLAVVNAKNQTVNLACRISLLYLQYVKAQDVDGLADLFPDGTVYDGPDGKRLSDTKTIAGGYARGFANMGVPWQFKLEQVLPFKGDLGCLLEFGHKTNEPGADFTLSAVDHIEVNEQGQITRFLPFFASTEVPRVIANINRHKTEAAAAEPVS